MDAAMHGHAEVVKLLLEAGVPVITTKQVIDTYTYCTSVTFQWLLMTCLLYTSPSPRDATLSRMPSSA